MIFYVPPNRLYSWYPWPPSLGDATVPESLAMARLEHWCSFFPRNGYVTNKWDWPEKWDFTSRNWWMTIRNLYFIWCWLQIRSIYFIWCILFTGHFTSITEQGTSDKSSINNVQFLAFQTRWCGAPSFEGVPSTRPSDPTLTPKWLKWNAFDHLHGINPRKFRPFFRNPAARKMGAVVSWHVDSNHNPMFRVGHKHIASGKRKNNLWRPQTWKWITKYLHCLRIISN